LLKQQSADRLQIYLNRIDGVMVSMLASSVVNREFEPKLSQTKDYKIGICCFSALKQQSADRHVAPLGHIILIPSQPVFALSP
jgi:hypothetical protein